LEEKIENISGWVEAEYEEYRISLRTAKDAIHSETLDILHRSKPLVDAIEEAGELQEAENSYTRMLASSRAMNPPQNLIVGGIDAIVELLGEISPANLIARCPNGYSPLYKAAIMQKEGLGHAIMIRAKETPRLLIRITNERDFSGQTILETSILHGCSLAFVAKLIENGAEVNPETIGTFWTPLQIASFRGLFSMVELLLNNGARVDHLPPGTETAIELALNQNHHDIAQRLGGASPAFSTPGTHREMPP
jgi:hypothetical protein